MKLNYKRETLWKFSKLSYNKRVKLIGNAPRNLSGGEGLFALIGRW